MATGTTRHRIAVLADLAHKVNRDRLAGILRFAAAKDDWELRIFTDRDTRPYDDRFIPDGIISFAGALPLFIPFRHLCRKYGKRIAATVFLDGPPNRRPNQ